eukprot:364833-Chlamydomonas_euryale.AAC.10
MEKGMLKDLNECRQECGRTRTNASRNTDGQAMHQALAARSGPPSLHAHILTPFPRQPPYSLPTQSFKFHVQTHTNYQLPASAVKPMNMSTT